MSIGLLAQHEAGISVMDHGAGKVLFLIEAPDPESAADAS
jgi:hypothetical protein